MRSSVALAVAAAIAGSCGDDGPEAARAIELHAPVARATAIPAPAIAPAARPQLDGRDFPDKVLALTWDDGPDRHTLELARYLHDQRVRGTFFVVRAWVDGVSADPGAGDGVFSTGFAALPILGDLVRLGHRLGNHTGNHVLLTAVAPSEAARQLRENQAAIAPFVGSGPRMFRAPGGAWGAAASAAIAEDADLREAWGPFRWDLDGKDWEGSRWCRSDAPATECEAGAPGGERRVKPSVVAARYLAQIERARHGIVLLHDRVGHVGSRYAVDVARALVPALRARGYVFAAPRLHFQTPAPAAGPFAPKAPAADGAAHGDLNGDGHADRCDRSARGVVCALATPAGLTSESLWLDRDDPGASAIVDASSIALEDLDGDGRADLCAPAGADRVCARAP